jgi:hypothetical protein
VALRVPVAWMEHHSRAKAASAALAEPVARAAIAALVALAAVAVLGRAAAVVWAWQPPAAQVAAAAVAALAGMRAVSLTAQLVVVLALVAMVARAGLQARWAPTPRP